MDGADGGCNSLFGTLMWLLPHIQNRYGCVDYRYVDNSKVRHIYTFKGENWVWIVTHKKISERLSVLLL